MISGGIQGWTIHQALPVPKSLSLPQLTSNTQIMCDLAIHNMYIGRGIFEPMEPFKNKNSMSLMWH